MDEKSFKAALQRLARRRTAQHVDIWTRIEPQLRPTKQHHRWWSPVSLRWATMITAGVIVLLFAGAGVYAMRHFLIFIPDFDSGLQQVHDDQFGVELAESQTVDGVMATLDWVYADQHRVAVFYSITQLDAPYQPVGVQIGVRLTLADGTELPQIFGGGGGGSGGGGGGGGEGDASSPPPPKINWGLSGSANFDTASITGDPSELNLQLELHPQLEVEPVDPAPGVQPSTIEHGPFTFDFAVPFIPAEVSQPQISKTASDITITLERLSLTPSSAQLSLCMSGLASDFGWLPEATLDTGQEVVSDIGFIGVVPKRYKSGSQTCAILDFLVPYRGKPEEWTLTIDRLYGIPPDESTSPEEITAVNGTWVFPISIVDSDR